MAERKLTQKQERLVINLFNGMSQHDAYLQAGYSSNQSSATIDRHACALLKNDKIKTRLKELREEARLPDVASFEERQKVLTEITRARMTDFMTCGADGTWYHDIGEETLNTAALKRVDSTTMPFATGGAPKSKDDPPSPEMAVILTKVELISPIEAIKELNKMDGSYAPEKHVNLNLEASDLTDEQLIDIITRGSRDRISEKAESTD